MSKKGIDMVAPLLLDDNFNGISDGILDIKHIDFPLEDLDGNALADDWRAFQLLELPSQEILAGLPSGFGGKLCDDDSGPFNTPCEFEEKPNLKNSSQRNGEAISNGTNLFGDFKDRNLFQTTSGSVSVLESGSSWSTDNSVLFGFRFSVPVKRARSKRLRPPTLNRKLTSIPFISCSEKRKGRRKSLSVLSGGNDNNNESTLLSNGTRKCSHCEVTKTPQWREGPMGPKTLCNACGVRYRSGRLFPEYRPAASPTFIATLHSNSHKKVVEMRKKPSREDGVVAAAAGAEETLRLPNPIHPVENSNGFLSV